MFTTVKKAFGIFLTVLTLVYTNGMIMQVHHCSMDGKMLASSCSDDNQKCCDEQSDVSCCTTQTVTFKITDLFETTHFLESAKIFTPIVLIFKHILFQEVNKPITWILSFNYYSPPESGNDPPLRILLDSFLC
ncbi:MAG: hypothetical protein K1X55_09715 [Chitinophagales bacterium]|nr:hypothetical protein [Chitinophagales bacterium]